MDLQNPKVQRILLISIVSAAMVYVFFFSSFFDFTYQMRSAQIEELQEQYEKLERDLERARLTVKNLAKVEREYEYLHRQWVVAQELLPEQNEVADLLRKISAAGQQAGLEFVSFKPTGLQPRQYYDENPIDLEFEGGFHAVGSFLSQVANLERIVNVRDLKLEGVAPEKQGDEDITHSLTGTLQLVAYTVSGGAAPPAEAPSDDLKSTQQRLGRKNVKAQGKKPRNGGH